MVKERTHENNHDRFWRDQVPDGDASGIAGSLYTAGLLYNQDEILAKSKGLDAVLTLFHNNMDASWDCLHCSFQEPVLIELKNLHQLPKAFALNIEILCRVFRDLELENDEVTVVFSPQP